MSNNIEVCEREGCNNAGRLIAGKWICAGCVPLAFHEHCTELYDSVVVLRDEIIRAFMSYKIIRNAAIKYLVTICGNPVEYYYE